MKANRRIRARRVSSSRTTILGTVILGAESVLALATSYLLTMLAAAALPARQRALPSKPSERRFAVLIPAHNEEAILAHTLRSLDRQDYPREQFSVAVVADNCSDTTAQIARRGGARVLDRHDTEHVGKGYALRYGIEQLQRDRDMPDAFVFLDADSEASPNLLTAIDARMSAGATAVQANYLVSNSNESWSSALRFAAFSLINTVRPLGKSRLGISCGLLGTGMGLRAEVLNRVPWDAYSLAEDADYHARLVLAGERVQFAPEACVGSAMPTTMRAAGGQQLRWEGGRWDLIKNGTPRLLRDGIRRRDARRVVVAIEPLVPPQSLLLATNLVLAPLAHLSREQRAKRLAHWNLVAQAGYVVGGLLVVRAPLHVFAALVFSPILMLRKLPMFVRIVAGKGPATWVRTERGPSS